MLMRSLEVITSTHVSNMLHEQLPNVDLAVLHRENEVRLHVRIAIKDLGRRFRNLLQAAGYQTHCWIPSKNSSLPSTLTYVARVAS
jgi:hypothetical protein